MAKFEKGHKGGPGRPKGSGHLDLGGWADEKGFPLLKKIAEGTAGGTFRGWKARIQAIQTLIAYEKGKPLATINANVSAESVTEAIRAAVAGGSGNAG
jgi:hypothetical protein